MDVALRVQNLINEEYDLDWSEASAIEIKKISLHAFENLNVHHTF